MFHSSVFALACLEIRKMGLPMGIGIFCSLLFYAIGLNLARLSLSLSLYIYIYIYIYIYFSVLINRDKSLRCRILAILGKTQRRPAGRR